MRGVPLDYSRLPDGGEFVAKAPWLKRDEVLELTIPSLKVGDGTYRVRWKGFTPSKYAHHED